MRLPVRFLFLLIVLAGLGVPSVYAEHHVASTAAAVAERYGLSGWDQIEQLAFTFNVQLPNRGEPIRRVWLWEPKKGRFTAYADTDFPVPVENDKLHDDTRQGLHAEFINDTYWLLFPFQLVWSDPMVITPDEVVRGFPIPEKAPTLTTNFISKLICQWPAEGGYTPGDAYDLYLGDDGLIQQWVFRRGGKSEGNAHTWEDHRQLGPIIVSLDHRNADGTFRLWFTDVKATLVDGTVVTPQPIDEP